MNTADFEIADIESFEVSVFFDQVKLETMHNKLQSLERGSFLSGMIKSDTFSQFMKEHIPSLQLTGNSFQIGIYHNSIKLIITSEHAEGLFRMPVDTFVPQEKLFAKDNLQKLNVDLNAVISMILGILGLEYAATKLWVKIELRKNNADYQTTRLSEKANPVIQSLLNEPVEIQSTNIAFKTKEVFLGTPVNAHYMLSRMSPLYSDKVNAVIFSGRFSCENKGVQDLNVILGEYLKRINDIVKKLTGGLKVNESV